MIFNITSRRLRGRRRLRHGAGSNRTWTAPWPPSSSVQPRGRPSCRQRRRASASLLHDYRCVRPSIRKKSGSCCRFARKKPMAALERLPVKPVLPASQAGAACQSSGGSAPRRLLPAACPSSLAGQFIAPSLGTVKAPFTIECCCALCTGLTGGAEKSVFCTGFMSS